MKVGNQSNFCFFSFFFGKGTVLICTLIWIASVRKSVRPSIENLLMIPEDFDVPEELTDDTCTEQAMQQALQLLTPQKRAVIRLRYDEGLSYKDTAARLGISTAAVNKHIVQALRILREHFKNAQSLQKKKESSN